MQRPHISNSELSAWTCTTRGLLLYAAQKDSEQQGSAPSAGAALHLALQSHFLGHSIDNSMAAFEGAYKQHALERFDDSHRLSWSNTSAIVLHYLRHNPPSRFPFTVLPQFVEEPIRVPLPWNEEEDLVAVVDLVGVMRDTEDFCIVDHKSTFRITDDWRLKWNYDPQLSLYLFATALALRQPVARGMAFINAIEFSKLPTSNRKCATHNVPFVECRMAHVNTTLLGPFLRPPEVISNWRTTAYSLWLTRKINKSSFRKVLEDTTGFASWVVVKNAPQEGLYNDGCKWCQFREFCQGGKSRDYYQNVLTAKKPSPITLIDDTDDII